MDGTCNRKTQSMLDRPTSEHKDRGPSSAQSQSGAQRPSSTAECEMCPGCSKLYVEHEVQAKLETTMKSRQNSRQTFCILMPRIGTGASFMSVSLIKLLQQNRDIKKCRLYTHYKYTCQMPDYCNANVPVNCTYAAVCGVRYKKIIPPTTTHISTSFSMTNEPDERCDHMDVKSFAKNLGLSVQVEAIEVEVEASRESIPTDR